MKCSNCLNILISTFRCRYCPKNFCSLCCLEIHCAKYHQEKNNDIAHSFQINSPYLIYGFLNQTISYDPFYSLKNFVPIYDEFGKLKIIGSGSYGQVYLALHTINKRNYAIKHMDKKKLFSILHSLSSIQKEIDIQSKIDHPNIVKLLFVKETNISYDLIMEYASTGSLFHYIRKFKGLNENKTFSLFIQVVNAVNFLHQNDLIHRDIKPENILIFDNNVVRLCDFGWCVKLNGHQRGTFCGTTEYMSPELVNHQGYGKEIDVWSLGVLLYEMIHGYSPFRPNKPKFNEKDVMDNIKNHNLIFGKRVSDECKELIYHLLDPNINMRYKVEDIYNSDFVKKYEILHFDYPDKNLVIHYNQNLIKNNKINEININENNENINLNNINNNIIYPGVSPKNDKKSNNIYNSMNDLIYTYNNEIRGNKNNCYKFYDISANINDINKQKNNSPTSLNRGLYSKYLNLVNDNHDSIYNENLSNNFYINNNINNDINNINNNINIVIESNNHCNQRNYDKKSELISNKTADNFYPLNIEKNREKEIIDIYTLHNNDKEPQDNKRDNKQFINFNNNPFLILSSQNQNSNISQINNNIWNNNNQNNNNIPQIKNMFNIQYNNIEKQNIITNLENEEKANKLIENLNIKNLDNNINYNYYYNFNNYNNNYTNNFFNNSYSSISNPILFIKKIPNINNNSNNNSINLNNNNYNNSTINSNCNIDKNQTPSTIPTSSKKNLEEKKNILNKTNIINNKKPLKISEFEVGEENYNISEKEQNDCDASTIKININNDHQIINNRKYLSKSDYSIIDKEKTDKYVNKKIDIKNMKFHYISNTFSVNNKNPKNNFIKFNNYTNRIINRTEEIPNLKYNIIQKKISSIYLKKSKSIEEQYNNKNNNIINIIDDKIKILNEKKDNIKIHEIKMINMDTTINNDKKDIISPENSNKKVNMKNILSKQVKSKSYCGKNNVMFKISDTSRKNNINNENKKKIIEKINKEKNNYINKLHHENINRNNNNKNIFMIKKDIKESNQNSGIGDVLCSLFHAFDLSQDQDNEINISKKDNNKNFKSNQDINKKILNKISKSQRNENLYFKNNFFVDINPRKGTNKINTEKNNDKYINNKEFITNINSNSKKQFIKLSYTNNHNINNNNPKILNLGHLHLGNSHSATDINKYHNLNKKTNSQSNLLINPSLNINNNDNNINKTNINKNTFNNINSNIIFNQFKKEIQDSKKILNPSTSSNEMNNEKINLNINNKIEINKRNLIKEIPIHIKSRNRANLSASNLDNIADLCDSRIITPKKGNIFNKVNPIKLLGAFKKELNNFSKKEQIFTCKVKDEKK